MDYNAGPPSLTGNELLAALQAMTPDQLARPVVIEGCDCVGYAMQAAAVDETQQPDRTDVDWPDKNPHIFIARTAI